MESPTFAQVLINLGLGIRLRRVDNAIYWYHLGSKMAADPNQRMLLCRRVLVAAGDDCFNVAVQLRVSDWFKNSLTQETREWYRDGVALIHLICMTDNWWSDPCASHYMLTMAAIQRRFDQLSELFRKMLAHDPFDPLHGPTITLLTHWSMHVYNDYSRHGGDRAGYAYKLVEFGRTAQNLPARMSAAVHARSGKALNYVHGYVGQSVYRLLYDCPLVPQKYPTVHSLVVADSVKKVKTREQPAPPPTTPVGRRWWPASAPSWTSAVSTSTNPTRTIFPIWTWPTPSCSRVCRLTCRTKGFPDGDPDHPGTRD
jgi:hypothetical protein